MSNRLVHHLTIAIAVLGGLGVILHGQIQAPDAPRNVRITHGSGTGPVSTRFDMGDRVMPINASANVRATPAGSIVGTQPSGALGTISGAPVAAALNGTDYIWWQVNFASGADGYVGEDSLTEYVEGGGGGGGGGNGSFPTGWNDTRFSGKTSISPIPSSSGFTRERFDIITSVGSQALGCRNFTARFFRIEAREGVRVCGGDVLIEDFYLRVTGSGSDHADAIQHYIGSPGTTLRDRNGNSGYQLIARRGVIEINGACTAGLFSADGSRGRIWLEDVKFITSTNCKGLRVNVDGGGPVSCVRCVFQNSPQVDVAIDVWENNTMLNGSPAPRPSGSS